MSSDSIQALFHDDNWNRPHCLFMTQLGEFYLGGSMSIVPFRE